MFECSDYDVIVPPETIKHITHHIDQIHKGNKRSGNRLAFQLAKVGHIHSKCTQSIEVLINTKQPCIFAESQVFGDGRDWTSEELRMLGDVSIATDVEVFDDGHHTSPVIFDSPWNATLIFVPGALLRNETGNEPADWSEIIEGNQIEQTRYNSLYKRRLLPVLRYINRRATTAGKYAVVTVPGLGCGQFAGPFQGTLGARFENALGQILETHSHELPNILTVYFDPYSECSCSATRFGHLRFLTQPLSKCPNSRPQLRRPIEYADCESTKDLWLFSIVAWDHVSWPGNDFYMGARSTDDGVKAAATSSMYVLTGVQGQYDRSTFRYLPPRPFESWESVVHHYGVRLNIDPSSTAYLD